MGRSSSNPSAYADAHNAAEALQQVSEHPYDLILLDLQLPDSSGLALLQKLRAADAMAPIAILTASNSPSDLDAARASFAPSDPWVLARLKLNLGVVLCYIGFFYVSLYHCGASARKFNPGNRPSAARVCHNAWYTALGAAQWTAWECVFVRCWATGKLPYVADADAFASWPNALRMVLWALAVPVCRELHFYWAHHFLHFRVLYKYVHSLHHRNTDIDPFSGLCMHPVEHLYYFSCVGPSLLFCMSPLGMYWNLIHLLISPAASPTTPAPMMRPPLPRTSFTSPSVWRSAWALSFSA